MIEVNGYTQSGSINATIDGVSYTIPDDLGNRHRQMIAEWEAEGNTIPAYQSPPINVSEVKIEAGRRIESILPDYKQRNILAFGLETMMTYGTDPSQWPEPLQQVNADMQAKWEAIKAIRIRSDEIEAMDPIPTDFRDDKHWPAD